MKYQFALILFTALAFLLANRASGTGLALAITQPLTMRNMAQNLYERVQLVFEKSLEDVEKSLNQSVKDGIEGVKGQVKEWGDKLKELTDKKASPEDIDAIKKDYSEKLVKMQEGLDEVILKLDKTPEPKEEKKNKSIMGQAEEAILKIKAELKEKGLTLKDMWNAGSPVAKEFGIDLKAVSNMTEAYALTGTNSNLLRGMEMEPGVAKDPTTPLFVSDIISVGATTNPTLYWSERNLLEGGAAQTAEAARFAQISAKYQKVTASAKKTAAYMKVSEESVEDIDFILSEMQDELINGPASIRVQLENQLLTGDGTGENHKGLFTLAPSFTLPNGFQTLPDPSHFDVVAALILQGTKANFNFDYVLLNPTDVTNMRLTKDKNGVYVIPPFMTGSMEFGGTKVIANNRIAEGSLLAGEFKRAKLFINRALTVKFFDQNEDDALYDLRTITGSIRGIFRVKGPDLKAFAKTTFAGAKTIIKTP